MYAVTLVAPHRAIIIIIRNLWENAGKSGEDRFIVRATVHKLKRESGNNLCGRFDHYKNGNQPFQLVNAVECMSVK